MNEHTISRAAESRGSERVGLGFGLLGSGVAWTLQLLGSYITAEFGCEAGLGRHVYAGVMLPAWILIGISVTAAGVSAFATVVAWRLMQRTGASLGASDEHGAEAYLARTGFLTSALFTAIIVVQSVPIVFYLGSC